MITLEQLNAATPADFVKLLDGTYEHSPWIAERACAKRPFLSLVQLKLGLADVVRSAEREAQLKLIRAHPELAGKAMLSKTLTAESTHEQGRAGLTECTPKNWRASASSTPPTTPSSASRSSLPCAARAAWA